MDAQGGKTIFCKMARPGQGEGKRGQGMVRAGHREGLRGQPECFFPPQPGSWFWRESHAAPRSGGVTFMGAGESGTLCGHHDGQTFHFTL